MLSVRTIVTALALNLALGFVLGPAAEAQFTPKTVETRSEREDLMFRVKLRAPVDMLLRIEDRVKIGLRGVAYLQVDPQTPWPADLALRLPD